MAVVQKNAARRKLRLLESDGEPLETYWHVLQIHLLLDITAYQFRGREDFFAGGNMFIYYNLEQARKLYYRGPDYFYVKGVPRTPMRKYWCVWQEGGRFPDLIIELLSPTTAKEDRTTKKLLYEQTFRTHEYVCYDPDGELLEAWRLGRRGRYRAIAPDHRGWVWLKEVGAWLGTWRGTYGGFEHVWLRFFDAEGRLLPTHAEAAAQKLADAEKRAAEALAELETVKRRLAEVQQRSKRGNGRRA